MEMVFANLPRSPYDNNASVKIIVLVKHVFTSIFLRDIKKGSSPAFYRFC